MNKTTLTFCGGTGLVTGANFLLESESTKLLIDCGLIQGGAFAEGANWDSFPYDPSSINFLLVTHSHMDHIGRIPRLVKEGFKGTIYSTAATRDLAEVMFEDGMELMRADARERGLDPLYEKKDVQEALSLWKGMEYGEKVELSGGFTATFRDAGHILGSSMIELERGGKKITFSGDLGNSPSLLLRDTEKITNTDYLVMESVYGDRNHQGREERRERLKEVIRKTIVRGGTLLIPVFSVERTQVLLYEMNEMVEAHAIPAVPVYLDSPLATKITAVYRRWSTLFNDRVQKDMKGGDDIFRFPLLTITTSGEDSAKIHESEGSKIIIAGSGMSNGGRILSHERRYLPGEKNTLLLVGYQAPGSLGRRLLEGMKEVKVDGEKIKVRSEVVSILGYSAHKDSDHLLEFVESAAEKIKKVFVVMGEPKSALFLVQRLRDYLGVSAVAPEHGDTVKLEL